MENCKLKVAHKKFDEAFVLWTQAHENYFNPERFITNINAVIVAIRSITYGIQTAKADIPDFDAWYAVWQDRMRADEALMWLHKTRNDIVHGKNFETYSSARVRLYDYGIRFLADIKVPIHLPNEAIVGYLLKEKLIHPNMIRIGIAMEIERTWIAPTYPKCDILYVLLCCFPFFHNMLTDAHQQANINIDTCPFVDKQRKNNIGQKIVQLLDDMRKPMTQRMSLKDLEPVEVRYTAKKNTEADMDYAKKRYDISDERVSALQSMNEIDRLIATAKTILQKDGHHHPMAFLFDEKGKTKQLALKFETRTDKYFAMESIAEIVKKDRIVRVILINESYFFSIEDNADFLKNMDIDAVKDKKEVLSIDILEKSKPPQNHRIFFERDKDGNVIGFQEPNAFETTEMNFIKPILKVWEEENK